MANHVFITHASEDTPLAAQLSKALEANGIPCWYAPRNVPFGGKFEEAIIDAITTSRLLILILSAHSNRSRHVEQEIACACSEDVLVPIIPFRIENIRKNALNKTLRYYLSSVHYVDALTEPFEAHIENLVNQVTIRLQQSSPQAELSAEKSTPEKEKRRSSEPVDDFGQSRTSTIAPFVELPCPSVHFDFNLLIEPDGNRFRASVKESPIGLASVQFELPYDEFEIGNFLLRWNSAITTSGDDRLLRDFGARLHDAVFGGGVRTAFETGLEMARMEQAGLRLRLEFKEAPKLIDLPWEFLYDSSQQRFIGLSTETPVSRYIPPLKTPTPLAVKRPLKMLVAVGPPGDVSIHLEYEKRKMHEALQEAEKRGEIEVHFLSATTLPALQLELSNNDYHIFHLVTQGGFDRHTADALVIFEDEKNQEHQVAAEYLSVLLHEAPSLRLVCLGTPKNTPAWLLINPMTTAARLLCRSGIPAVIGMQFGMPDNSAITFAREFYGSIAAGDAPDVAMAATRKAIYQQGDRLQWSNPVLFTCARKSSVFELKT
jgi:hypothetical protein